MITTTLNKIREHSPCYPSSEITGYWLSREKNLRKKRPPKVDAGTRWFEEKFGKHGEKIKEIA